MSNWSPEPWEIPDHYREDDMYDTTGTGDLIEPGSLVRYHNGNPNAAYEYGIVKRVGQTYVFVRFFGEATAKAVAVERLEVG